MNVKHYVVLMVMLAAVWLHAADSAARPADADLKAIGAQLASTSADERQAGIAAIRDMIQQQPQRASSSLRSVWGKQLLDAKEFEALHELSLAMILVAPADTGSVETLMQFRVRCAIGAGKNDLALAHAKSLFNVSSMANTSSAMLLVAEALTAANPADPSKLNQFKQEQIAGAKPSTRPTTAAYTERPDYGSGVMASIHVNPGPYLQKARSTFGEDYWSLQGRGNLMLLADRPAEARELFERAYSAAQEGQLVQASENLARCIKAEDGVIGRANSWVMAIRPGAK